VLFIESSLEVRVTAATNKNLEAAIKERMFREDLYYRLKVDLHPDAMPS
jgi:transcriptional regulator of aroF, aroG, tyrA and aromatic amino acid transport